MKQLINDSQADEDLLQYILTNLIGAEFLFPPMKTQDRLRYDRLLALGITEEGITNARSAPKSQISRPILRQVLLLCIDYKLQLQIPSNIMYNGGQLNIRGILCHALTSITSSNIQGACEHMFKRFQKQDVPHEYFYHAYVVFAFRSLIDPKQWGLSLEMNSPSSRNSCNIVLIKLCEDGQEDPDPVNRYVIEMMASDLKTIEAHIDKTVEYGNMFGAANLWMVQILCSDQLHDHPLIRGERGQNVNILIAQHNLNGEWMSMKHAPADIADPWETLTLLPSERG